MTNEHIEKRLKKAFSDLTPDIIDSILQDCKQDKGKMIEYTEVKKSKAPFYLKLGTVAAAAAVVIVVTGTAGSIYSTNYKAVSAVSLDVNPSIEISVNKYDKVIKAVPKNEDAKNVIGEMKLGGVPLDVALNALIGAMFNDGYITDEQNTVLISVEADDGKKSEALCKSLIESVDTMIGEKEMFEPSLIIQNVTSDKRLKKMSEEYCISTGKAALIDGIVESAPERYSFEELSHLSITELNLIIEGNKSKTQNIETIGAKASELAYVGTEKATEIALAKAAVSADAVIELECELDIENGIMVYEVEFDHGGNEYTFDINAVSGEIIFSEIEVENEHFEQKIQIEDTEKVPEIIPEEKPSDVIDASVTEQKKEHEAAPEKVIPDIPHREPSEPPDKIKPEPIKPELITKEKAIEIAISHAKLSASDVRNKKAELEHEDGVVSYEIEFESKGIEYEYEIDAQNGSIIDFSSEKDDEHDEERNKRGDKDREDEKVKKDLSLEKHERSEKPKQQ